MKIDKAAHNREMRRACTGPSVVKGKTNPVRTNGPRVTSIEDERRRPQ